MDQIPNPQNLVVCRILVWPVTVLMWVCEFGFKTLVSGRVQALWS